MAVPTRHLASYPGRHSDCIGLAVCAGNPLDKDLSAYYDASYGEFMERERKQKEAEHDVHPISNQ